MGKAHNSALQRYPGTSSVLPFFPMYSGSRWGHWRHQSVWYLWMKICKGLWTKLDALNRVLKYAAVCRFAFPKCCSISIISTNSSDLWAYLFYAWGTTHGHFRQRNHTLQLKQKKSSMNFQLYSMLSSSTSLEEMVFFLPSICPRQKQILPPEAMSRFLQTQKL